MRAAVLTDAGVVRPRTRRAIACGAALTSPRLPSGRLRPSSTGYGEVGICALVAQIPGEGASPQALTPKFELGDRPPHPDPLPTSGERERKRRATYDRLARTRQC